MCLNCMKSSGCGCGCGSSSNSNGCVNLGPFVAVDAACIQTPSPTGSIIPFSSGVTTVALATLASGLAGTPSLIGFGTATPGVTITGNTLDLTGLVTEAFTVPRNGSITSIAASFTPTVGVSLLGSTTVKAQVYKAPAGSNVFTATNAAVNLAPAYTGAITTGSTASASATIPPVSVTQGDRLVMVYTIEPSGVAALQTLTGTASAGITIS